MDDNPVFLPLSESARYLRRHPGGSSAKRHQGFIIVAGKDSKTIWITERKPLCADLIAERKLKDTCPAE
jgi:hypothetical protein